MQNGDNSSVQNNSRLKRLFLLCRCFFLYPLKDDRPQVCMQLISKTNKKKKTFALPFFHEINKRVYRSKWMSQQNKTMWKWSFYFTIFLQPLVFIGSSLETTHCTLFWSPHPFKIEASLQNSLFTMYTSLHFFLFFFLNDISQCLNVLECWPG